MVWISRSFYLPYAHNLGILVDSSQHWGSSYFNGLGHATDYYGLGGLQYKYHTDSFSPFVHVFAGAIHQIPPGFFLRATNGMRRLARAAVSITTSGQGDTSAWPFA